MAYEKVVSVVNSCKTFNQLMSAQKMINNHYLLYLDDKMNLELIIIKNNKSLQLFGEEINKIGQL